MPGEAPKVTIGVPVYNGGDDLRRALTSLLAQDFGDFELVISDNASTDETPAICAEFARRDPRVRVIRQPTNIGAIPNFAVLANEARGRYFMWAAVDDDWLPGFVSATVAELDAHPEAGVAMTALDRVTETGEVYDHIRFDRDGVNEKSHYDLVLALTSPRKFNLFVYGLFRTALVREAMRFAPQVPAWERLFLCQIALASTFRYVDRMLHLRRHHEAPSHVRLPDEAFNRLQTQSSWTEARILARYASMLYRSTLVPAHRKLYTPLILRRYGWLLVRSKMTAQMQRRVGSGTWQRLAPARKILRKVLIRP